MSNSTTKKSQYSVYVIRLVDTDVFKIGMSNNVSSRVSAIQTGNPHKVDIVKTYAFERRHTAQHVERVLHVLFDDQCVRSEWFTLSHADLVSIDRAVSMYRDGLSRGRAIGKDETRSVKKKFDDYKRYAPKIGISMIWSQLQQVVRGDPYWHIIDRGTIADCLESYIVHLQFKAYGTWYPDGDEAIACWRELAREQRREKGLQFGKEAWYDPED